MKIVVKVLVKCWHFLCESDSRYYYSGGGWASPQDPTVTSGSDTAE